MPKKVCLKNYYLDIGYAVGMAIVGHTIFLNKAKNKYYFS